MMHFKNRFTAGALALIVAVTSMQLPEGIVRAEEVSQETEETGTVTLETDAKEGEGSEIVFSTKEDVFKETEETTAESVEDQEPKNETETSDLNEEDQEPDITTVEMEDEVKAEENEENEEKSESAEILENSGDNIASGSYEGITWVIDANGKLTVEGTGEFAEIVEINVYNRAPWYQYRGSIYSAEINVTNITNMTFMFYGCGYLTKIDLSGLDAGTVTNMGSMFSGCASLKEIDLSGLDTGTVTNMACMFERCSRLTSIDLSGLNTRNVTSMEKMFSGCSRLTSIDLSGLDTRNVTGMSYMFGGCTYLKEIDLSGFDTRNVTSMEGLFSGCSSLTSIDLSGLDTRNVTDMSSMFDGCSSLTGIDLSGLNTRKVIYMRIMFNGCSSLTSIDLSGLDTRNVENMQVMFSGCSSLTSIDLSGFDTRNVENMLAMFNGCNKLNTIYTPCNLNLLVSLDGNWYKADGTKISKLPQNLDYSIQIMREQVPSIIDSYISVMKKRTAYECGDALNVDDMTVKYYDTDGSIRKVTGYTINADDIDMSVAGVKILTVTYNGCSATVKLTVGKIAKITGISVSDSIYTGKPVGYSGNASVQLQNGTDITNNVMLTYTYSGTMADGSSYTDTDQAPVNAGEYTLTVSVAEDDENYTGSSEYNFEIRKTYASVVASNLSLDLGSNLPLSYEYQITGLVDGDVLITEPSFTCDADMEKEGFYQIIPHDADAGMNYELDYVNGVLTVKGEPHGSYKNIRWNIDDNGKLTVEGTGEFSDSAESDRAPWYFHQSEIVSAQINVTGMVDASYMFYACSNLTSVDLSGLDAGSIINMQGMFSNCYNLTNVDLSGLDLSNVNNMRELFESSGLISIDLSNVNVENATDIGYMFAYCESLSNVNFSGANFNSVTNRKYIFDGCSSLINADFSNADFSSVVSISEMFAGCESLISVNFSNADFSSVTNRSEMFSGCENLSIVDLSNANFSSATSLYEMFSDCYNLTSVDFSGADFRNVTSMHWMFLDCYNLTSVDFSDADFRSVISMNDMFYACSSLTSVDFRNFIIKDIKYMENMFGECSSLKSVDLSSFITNNVEIMGSMFYGCSSLTSVDMSGFNTSNVSGMSYMFSGCSSLTSIDLSSFNACNVEYISDIFSECDNLETIYTPYNLKKSERLSGNWYKTDGTTISTLPRNIEYSILIKRNEVPSVTGSYIKAMKRKTTYKCGDILHTDDLTVKCYDAEGTVRSVTDYTTNADKIDMSTSGTRTLIITYRGYTTEIPIIVKGKETPVKISGITVSDMVYTGKPFGCTGTAVVATDTGVDVTTDISLTYTYTGMTVDGNIYRPSAEAPVNAGNYRLTIAVSKENSDYKGSAEYVFKITKAPVEITASNVILFVGDAIPTTYKYQVKGLLNRDELITEPSFTCNADMSNADTYEIVPYGADAGINYEIAYTKGIFIVKEDTGEKESVTISKGEVSDSVYTGKPYNGKISAKLQNGLDITDSIMFTYNYSGTQADGSSYGPSENAPANAGTYTLTVTAPQNDAHYTYDADSMEYSFEITKALITVVALDNVFQIGKDTELPVAYPYEVTGLVEDDKLTTEPSFTYTDTDGNEINKDSISLKKSGSYHVIPKEADAGMNYTVNYQKGTLTIKAATGDLSNDDNEVLPDDIPQAYRQRASYGHQQ